MKTFHLGNKNKTHFVSASFSLMDIHPQCPKLFWRSVFLTGKWMGIPAICKKFQCTICAGEKSILQCPDMNLVNSSFLEIFREYQMETLTRNGLIYYFPAAPQPTFLRHLSLDPVCPLAFKIYASPPLFSVLPPFKVFQTIPPTLTQPLPAIIHNTPTFLTHN